MYAQGPLCSAEIDETESTAANSFLKIDEVLFKISCLYNFQIFGFIFSSAIFGVFLKNGLIPCNWCSSITVNQC